MAETVVPVTQTVVHPATGEVLDLRDQAVDQLAEAISRVRELETMLRQFKADVGSELLRRMDTEAKWTLEAGGWKITGDSPNRQPEYDGQRLRAALTPFVEERQISERALEAAVETVVTHRPRAQGLKALRALGDSAINAAIDSAVADLRPRRVRAVSRA